MALIYVISTDLFHMDTLNILKKSKKNIFVTEPIFTTMYFMADVFLRVLWLKYIWFPAFEKSKGL